jgi:hypothetical protein
MVIELVQVGFSQQLPQKLVMTFQFHKMVLATCCQKQASHVGLKNWQRALLKREQNWNLCFFPQRFETVASSTLPHLLFQSPFFPSFWLLGMKERTWSFMND